MAQQEGSHCPRPPMNPRGNLQQRPEIAAVIASAMARVPPGVPPEAAIALQQLAEAASQPQHPPPSRRMSQDVSLIRKAEEQVALTNEARAYLPPTTAQHVATVQPPTYKRARKCAWNKCLVVEPAERYVNLCECRSCNRDVEDQIRLRCQFNITFDNPSCTRGPSKAQRECIEENKLCPICFGREACRKSMPGYEAAPAIAAVALL